MRYSLLAVYEANNLVLSSVIDSCLLVGTTLTQMHVVSGGIRTLWEGCALQFKWDHETHAAVSDFWPRLFELTSLLLSRGPIFPRDKNIPPPPPPAFCPLPSPVKVGPRPPTSLLWGASPFQMRLSFVSPPFFFRGDVIFNFCLPPSPNEFPLSLVTPAGWGSREAASRIKMVLWTDGFHQLLVPFPALRGDSIASVLLIYLQRRLGSRHRKIKLCSQVTHTDVTKPILRD